MSDNEITEQQFRRQVHQKNEDEPEVALKRACDHYTKNHDQLLDEHVSGANLLAMHISGYSFSYLYDDVEERYLWTTDDVSVLPNDELSDDTIIQSDQVLDRIEDDTREVRERIFGSPEAPFDRPEDMLSWIKEVVEEEQEASGTELRERMMDLATEYRNEYGDVDLCFKSYSISYFVLPECKIISIDDIPAGTRLDPLFDYQKKLSEETGFTEPALLLYLMTGIRPLLPRWKIERVKSDVEGVQPLYQVDVYADNITADDMTMIHRKIKEMKGIKSIQPFRERDRLLIAVVDSMDGVPEEGVDSFWEEVLERCNDLGVDSWSTANSPKMRWRRLQEKLE
jgi:hypothetical protein